MFPAALNAAGSSQQGDVSDREAAARRSFTEIRFFFLNKYFCLYI